MRRLTAIVMMIVFVMTATTAEAAPQVKLQITAGASNLKFMGKGLFTLKTPGLPNMTIKKDPEVYINGKFIGWFPTSTVRIVLKNGISLICKATGPQGNTTEVWIVDKRKGTVTLVVGCYTKNPRTKSRVSGFSPSGLDLWMEDVAGTSVIKYDPIKKKWVGVLKRKPTHNVFGSGSSANNSVERQARTRLDLQIRRQNGSSSTNRR